MKKRIKKVLGIMLSLCIIAGMFALLGATNAAQAEEKIVEVGKDRYCAIDFEDAKMLEEMDEDNDLIFKGGSEIVEGEDGNHYVSMIPGAWWLWNYYAKWNLSEYVIFEADFASTELGSTQFGIFFESGPRHDLVKIFEDGTMEPAHEATQAKIETGVYVNIAIGINAVDKTYTVWYDREKVLENAPLPADNLGDAWYPRFEVSAGEATAHLYVDNVKVYNGVALEDFEGTTQLEKQELDDSWVDEYVGKEGYHMLDYGTEALAVINAANAVMVNTDTLYVYQNGERTEKTKAEVDALVAGAEGKKVIKNEYGLVIISETELELTDEQLASLQKYMLYTRPKAADITALFNSVNAGHPRIMMNQEKLDKIRADYKSNDIVKKWAEDVITSADNTLKNGNISLVSGYASMARSVMNRSMELSMAYLLTGDAKYKDFLWEDLMVAANITHWGHNQSYLNTGEFAAGVAIAYDWLYDEWTEDQRELLETAVYEKAIYYQFEYFYGKRLTGNFTFVFSPTNRNAVCNGGIGLAALAMFEVDPVKYADVLEKTYQALEIMMMEQFAPSGGNNEGPSYWAYTMQLMSKFMSSTELAFGTDFNLYETPGFENTGDYYLDVDGMTGVNNFHDATESTLATQPYLFWLSNALDKPVLTEALLIKMDMYDVRANSYALVFYDSDIEMPSKVNKPLDAYYNGIELVSMRSSWLNSAGIYASIHSGKTQIGGHEHIDSGTFVLDIGGQRFAGDIGKEDYNLPATGEYRYYYYRLRPEGHNVFVINPDKKGKDLGQNIDGAEVISEFVTKDRGAYTIVSLDSYYASYAQSATRGMMLGDDRNSVLIRDEIRGMTKDENEVWWFMQMENVEVKISDDKKSAVLSKNGVDVNLQVLSDNAIDYEIKVMNTKEMYPRPGLAGWAQQTENKNWSRLAIVFKAGKDLNINVKFAEVDNAKGDTPIKDVSLADWEIEDGVLVETPTLNSLTIGDKKLPGFNSNVTFYQYELPYGTTECPEVTVTGGENCDIEIKKPKTLPGYLKIKLTNQNDSSLETTYKIMLTVAGEVSIEASAFQDGNPPKNCMDGQLATRWAVYGTDCWGIYTFAEPKRLDAVWIAFWLSNERSAKFGIEVSEDGENFTRVWEGVSTMLEKGQPDALEEFKIPEGTYKAIKLTFHGAQYPDNRKYDWNSILEVEFRDLGGAEQPTDGADSTGGADETEPNGTTGSENDATQSGDVGVDQPGGKNDGSVIWIAVAVVAVVAVAAVVVALKKKGAKKAE